VSSDQYYRKPTRVGMTIGTTTRNGGEFEFRKIALSLDRDLAGLENPIDAFRDIKALLERMVTEFQVGKPSQIADTSAKASPNTSAAKTQQTSNQTPRVETSKPPTLTVETVRERLTKWLPDLEILNGFDGFAVKPKRYLGDIWKDVNDVMRSLGGKWQKGLKPADGSWRIPK
jgi:hypothetical protein